MFPLMYSSSLRVTRIFVIWIQTRRRQQMSCHLSYTSRLVQHCLTVRLNLPISMNMLLQSDSFWASVRCRHKTAEQVPRLFSSLVASGNSKPFQLRHTPRLVLADSKFLFEATQSSDHNSQEIFHFVGRQDGPPMHRIILQNSHSSPLLWTHAQVFC